MIKSDLRCGLIALVGALGVATSSAASAAVWSIPAPAEDEAALAAATRAVCGKDVVLLGEAAHGNGHSDAFKSAMVERLVSRCGFRAVLFEASFYEFVPLWRARRGGQAITPAMIGTAVGGMWKFDREFQPLLSFLAGRAGGGLFLGGLDFQIGTYQQDYANEGVIAELTAGLPPAQAVSCRQIANARIEHDLDEAERSAASTCVAAIRKTIAAGKGERAREQRMMLANLDAIFAAGFEQGASHFIALRDLQMFRNMQLLSARLPRGTKIIIWTANAHAANGADEASEFAGVRNLGSYIADAYGSRSYALATTALGGDQRWGKEHKLLPPAPEGSLEALAFKSGGTASVFLGNAALERLGPVSAAAFSYQYATADWSRRFGGIVVFHQEHAAFSSRFGN